uniref:PX domain-containing protein n=1 Tax=Globisporangium ultimum (strain ATCC 200006 / CBS 805.95 / DAOM BR144) TaxID=431595 RepID=K3X9R5_GLOUD
MATIATTSLPTMPVLTPMCIIPRRASRASAPLAFLQKIDAIEINHTYVRNGVVYYVLDVYLKHYTSRIPTNQKPTTPTQREQSNNKVHERRSKPDYQVEKRFTDFADFRYRVWVHAQRNHGCKCAYCDAFMDFIVYSLAQPRLLVKLATGTSMRKKLFTTFCNEFVRLARGGNGDQPLRPRDFQCAGFQMIPSVVENFFRDDHE